MLVGMDAPTATAWLVLGMVLGVLAGAAVTAGVFGIRHRRGRTGRRVRAPDPVDDLAGFFEHPPGSRPGAPPPTGWATLTSPPPPPPPAHVPADPGPRRAHLWLAALSVAGLVVVGIGAAVVVGVRTADPGPVRAGATPDRVPPRDRGDDGAVVGELSVGGLVLEPRAVGTTAVYPEVRLRAGDDAASLELWLPTWNCLTTEPPPDPVAAGCVASLVEHASLGPAELRVDRDGDRLTVRGRATTEIRPAGSAPEPTGRVYELELTVAPGGRPAGDGARPAVGELRLGTGAAPVVPGRSTLRTEG
jgi:hypothetical protein